MRLLALIPARGGSKRLPGKNIRSLGDQPLIEWSIRAAAAVSDIGDILVSTDDPAIAGVARAAGALVPWLRPPELATDSASSVDVALHALEWYERERGGIDALVLLQPTSPFRTARTIERGIDVFIKAGRSAVVAVSPLHAHPMWAMKIENDRLEPFLEQHGLNMRSQDLPPAYAVNGVLYVIAPADLRATKSFLGHGAVPLVIGSPREAIDIDTEWDWRLAEAVLGDT